MAAVVNTHEAKTQLSKLLARVEQGEEIVIARAGKPIARLVPASPRRRVLLGTARGQIEYLPGWDAPLTEQELAEWYEGPVFPGADE